MLDFIMPYMVGEELSLIFDVSVLSLLSRC